MTAISSLGVGSHLDLATLLTQLQTAESQPLADLQNRQQSFSTKLSAYGQIQSSLANLQTAANKLADPSLFKTVAASTSASSVLSATASTTSTAGTFGIHVSQLAQAQSLVSKGQVDTTSAIGSGVITIDFGTVSGGTLDPATGQYTGASFAADTTRTAVPITIKAGSNSLGGIRDAINAANAGVSASIVNDGSGTPSRLVLTSAQTGEVSSMRVSVTGDAALQNLLSNDPAGTQNLQQTVVGQDAKLTVNGIAVKSSSNTVKEAIQGTTLTLAGTGDATVAATVDSSAASSAISAFVKAYNSLQSTASGLTAYDPSTKVGGPLLGDATLRNLQTSIRQTLTSPQAAGTGGFTMLSDIGVSFQTDGTLAIDATKLQAALGNKLGAVSDLFAGTAGSTGGFGKQLSALVTKATGDGGSLKAAQDGVNTTLKDLSDQYTAMQAHVDSTVARYKAQFTQLDLVISNMNSTLAYLQQQFASSSGSNSSN